MLCEKYVSILEKHVQIRSCVRKCINLIQEFKEQFMTDVSCIFLHLLELLFQNSGDVSYILINSGHIGFSAVAECAV